MHGSAGGCGGGVFRGDLGGERHPGPRRPEKPRAGVELAPGLLGGSRASHPPGPGSGFWLGEGPGESAGGKRELHPSCFLSRAGHRPSPGSRWHIGEAGLKNFSLKDFFFFPLRRGSLVSSLTQDTPSPPTPPRTGIGNSSLQVGPIRCMFAPVTWVTWNLGTDLVVST